MPKKSQNPAPSENAAEAAALLKKGEGQYRWAVILRENGENIGQVSFCRLYEDASAAEIEYCLGKAFRGRGLTTEAVRAFLGHTFQNTAISKIEAFHRAENTASGRVLRKSGMVPAENVLRFPHLDRPPDGVVCYAVTRAQFAELP